MPMIEQPEFVHARAARRAHLPRAVMNQSQLPSERMRASEIRRRKYAKESENHDKEMNFWERGVFADRLPSFGSGRDLKGQDEAGTLRK